MSNRNKIIWEIERIYGLWTKNTLIRLKRNFKKIICLQKDIYFMKKCIKYKKIPKFLIIKNQYLNEHEFQYRKLYRFQMQILKSEISVKKQQLNKNKKFKYLMIKKYFMQINETHRIQSMQYLNSYNNYLAYNIFKNVNKKLSFMKINNKIEREYNVQKEVNLITGFYNETEIQFNYQELEILRGGANFTPDIVNYANKIDVIASTELTYEQIKYNYNLSEGEKTMYKKILSEFSEFVIKNHNKQIKINNKHKNILKEIKNKTKQAIFIKADKQNSIVLLNKDDFQNKMERALNQNNFKLINKTRNLINERKINKILLEMKKEKIISGSKYLELYKTDTRVPTIFPNIKTHKEEKPLRLIINGIDTFFERTSKWLLEHTKKYYTETFTVNNAIKVIDKLKYLKIKKSYRLVSYDIKNMYSNIQAKEAIEMLVEGYDRDENKEIKMHKDRIRELLDLCVIQADYEYNGKYYKQETGIPTGGALSALLANIYLQEIDKEINDYFKNKIILYIRYLDDICILYDEDLIDNMTIFEKINNMRYNLEFTFENEKNKKLAYLDLLIIREEEHLNFDVYRKDTFNQIILNFKSNYDKKIKTNILEVELKRAHRYCSTTEILKNQLDYIKNLFLRNDYPLKIIQNTIEKITKIDIKNWGVNNCNNRKKKMENNTNILVMPAQLQKDYKLINKKWGKNREIMKETNNKVNLAYRAPKNIEQHLCKLNGREEKSWTTDTIYEWGCQDCQNIYIGQSGKRLNTRLDQHLTKSDSAVFNHIKEYKHNFIKENAKILSIQRDRNKREMVEAIEIERRKPGLNKNPGKRLEILPLMKKQLIIEE